VINNGERFKLGSAPPDLLSVQLKLKNDGKS
jgi:hypothetical protein